MKGLTLSAKEEKRARVLIGVLDRRWTGKQAAAVLKVSERHLWRMLAAYRAEGPAALVHGNRGHQPANSTRLEIRERALALAQGKYAGFNDCHLAEVLEEREGMRLPRSTLQRLLREAGLRSPKRRRAPRHRSRRQRYPREGKLLQIDGSPHAWLEDRRPRLTLLGAIDDATGTVPYALFREQEDSHGYLLLLRGVVERKGIPLALYSDRHGIFTRSGREPETLEEQLAGKRRPTQFGDVLQRLDIELVLAHSPQAKGRVERLWGTLQSRLVSELRLAGAVTLEEANEVLWRFLPAFNQRFGVPPVEAGSAYRPPQGVDLDAVLCFHYFRKVGKDNTVGWRNRVLQLPPGKDRSSYAQAVVEVQERLSGQVVIFYKGAALSADEAPAVPEKLRPERHRGWGRKGHLGDQLDLLAVTSSSEGRDIQETGGGGPGLGSEDRHVHVAKSRSYKPPPTHPWRTGPLTKSVSK